MEEPLNSPVIHSAQPPDFGNSFIDAFKANTLDDAASADESANSASQVTEEPKQKKSSTRSKQTLLMTPHRLMSRPILPLK